jgi:hypothetical protein
LKDFAKDKGPFLLCSGWMKTQSGLMESEATCGLISVRVPGTDEVPWFDGLLAGHHYLGAGQPVGDYLRQVVEQDGKPVALLVWGPACYALKDRDLWISWSVSQRLERLKLVVQNRRFLVLAQKRQSPNLASQTMGAALRSLPELWREHFGYRPLLAERFTDPEAYAGTCYKASNWEAVGHSAGYSRHRADFYIPNERPKRLWLRPLTPDARQRLRSVQGARRLPGRAGGCALWNAAGQRRATGFAPGCFPPGSGPAPRQYPLSHWPGVDTHRDGTAGRTT